MMIQVISAAGAVKHDDVVEQVKKLFTKLSNDPTTASQLVAEEPAIFTGSEVGMPVFNAWSFSLSHVIFAQDSSCQLKFAVSRLG